MRTVTLHAINVAQLPRSEPPDRLEELRLRLRPSELAALEHLALEFGVGPGTLAASLLRTVLYRAVRSPHRAALQAVLFEEAGN